MGVDRTRQGAGGRGRLSQKTFVVIPAGGAGTRLWPRSRRSTPKHVLPLGGHGQPLLRETYERASSVGDEVFVLTEMRQREVLEAGWPPPRDPAPDLRTPAPRPPHAGCP